MEGRVYQGQVELTALAVWPSQEIAQDFTRAFSGTGSFHIMSELKSYPARHALELRLRQLNPDVVLLDVATDFGQAVEIIQAVAAAAPATQVVGLDTRNDPQAILESLRAGATEFLYSPFDACVHGEALARLARLRQRDRQTEMERGKVIVFASSKSGSGASTLASQTAFALKTQTLGRILLVDLDFWNGTVGFQLRLNHRCSVADAIEEGDTLAGAHWSSLVSTTAGIDVLPAPENPMPTPIPPDRLHPLLELSRRLYEWVIVDSPTVFSRLGLLILSHSDRAFLVTTPELPSLHLARRAVAFLGGVGFTPERYQVLINRVSRHDTVRHEDMAKIFHAPVSAVFPNDCLTLHDALTNGQPLGERSPLGRSIHSFAQTLSRLPLGQGPRASAQQSRTLPGGI